MYILGYSGHAYVIIDAIISNSKEVFGYFEKTPAKNNPYKIEYRGLETEVDIALIVKSNYVFPAIGSNAIRKKAVQFIEEKNLNQTIVIDQSAKVSTKASIKKSSFIGPNAIVNSMTKIGKGCIINSAAIVEHECIIEDFTHIAPGAILAGNVTIGTSSFIGAGAIIKQGVTIGNNVTIGAGTVVLNDVNSNEIWVGNPARILM